VKKQRSIPRIEIDADGFMVLVYVISVIFVEYTISYKEIYFLVKRRLLHFALLYRPNY